MPLTHLHFGPALLLGLLLFSHTDLPTLLVSSVILDLEPFSVLFFGLPGPLHGPFHSYTLSGIAALATASAMWLLTPITRPLSSFLNLSRQPALPKMLASAVLGTYLHVTLDSFLYPEMRLLYPIEGNPFLGLVSAPLDYSFCALSFIAGLALYFYRRVQQLQRS